MSDFDERLRSALARKQPGPGFTGRVMAKLPERRRTPWRAWAAAMAATLVLTMGGLKFRDERRQAEEAKRQLMLALEITGEKLALVERKLHTGRQQ